MSTSAKNKLQEIYQKKQLDVPVYNSVNLSGIPNEPAWRSQVVTCDGHKVWSRQFSKKTHAENDAAEKCLILIGRKTEQQIAQVRYIQPDVPKTIILLDLENVPLSARTRLTTKENDVRILGFVGKYNRGILKDREQIETMMELIIADCTGANAADHAMTFYAGILSCQYAMRGARDAFDHRKIKWFLVSSDQFAAVPIEFLKKNGYTDSHSVTCLEDLKRMLPELNYTT